MSVFGRGVRNAFRNGIRTFSIVVILSLSIAMALAMLLAREAVDDRIESVEGSIGNVITISPAGVRGLQGGGEPLVEAEVAALAKLAHVAGVTMTLQDRLAPDATSLQSAIDLGTLGRRFAQGGGAGGAGGGGGGGGQLPANVAGRLAEITPPVIVVGTTDPSSLQVVGSGRVQLEAGNLFAASSEEDVAVIGKALAEKNGPSVGSTFTAYGSDVKVAGVFTTGNTFGDTAALFPLRTLQRLSGQPGALTGATVQVDSIQNLDATQAAISDALGPGADVVSQQDTSQQALEPLENIQSISAFSLTGAVVAGAAIIFLTMLMIVRERRREIAVLKAVGAPNRKVILQFTYEAMTFTGLAAVLGVLGGMVAGNPVTRLLANTSEPATPVAGQGPGGLPLAALRQAVRGTGQLPNQLAGINLDTLRASVGLDILAWGLLAALVITAVGSAVPSWLVARVRPAEVLRGE